MILMVMDIQPKHGVVFSENTCKIDFLRDNGLKFGRLIQCNPANDTRM